MKTNTLTVTKSMIIGYHNIQSSNKGLGIVINVPDDTELKSGMFLSIGDFKFRVNGFDKINHHNNSTLFQLNGYDVVDFILSQSFK